MLTHPSNVLFPCLSVADKAPPPRPRFAYYPFFFLPPPFPRASAMHLTPTPRHEPANPPGQSVLTRVTICTGGEYSAACNNLTFQKSLEIQDVTLRSCGVPHGAMMACPIAVLSCPPARGVLRLRDWHAAGCRVSGAIACDSSDAAVCQPAAGLPHGCRYRVAGNETFWQQR